MRPHDVKWLYVEPTTRCNAWCSGCRRNNAGFGLATDEFTLTDLSVDILNKTIELLPNLEMVQLGGNFGDPCAGKLIDKQIDILSDKKISVQIHTNGSLRTRDWWQTLPKRINDLVVWFAIDGLADTHSIYRQATNWNKIIDNAKSFIDAGGNAVWQFIPFRHNEHQIKECMKMATSLGFSRFEFVKDARYSEVSYDYRTGKPVKIEPWSQHTKQWKRKGGILSKNTTGQKNTKVVAKNCMHLSLKSLYLSAEGTLSPCCYLYKENHTGFDIKKSIANKDYLPTCVSMCGSPN